MKQQDAVNLLKSKLEEYLREKGVNIPERGNFSCPIPGCSHAHGDRTPSAGFLPGCDKTVVHCFKSGKSVDIFTLFAMENNLAQMGVGFYTETLPALARKYEIEYESEDISDEAKETFKMLKAYSDATHILVSNEEAIRGKIERFAKLKGIDELWSEETTGELLIGGVNSFEEYKKEMLKHWKEDYLEGIELLNERIFNPDNLIFTICSAKGDPIAFVARNLRYGIEDVSKPQPGPKFNNSHTSRIYKKSNILYNFHNCRTHCTDGTIWVFEGYGDAVTAWQAGLRNSCAIGATAFTKEHMDVLITSPAITCIMVMDGDQAGIDATNRIVDNFCKGGMGLNLRFILLPGGMDGDEFIREKGIEEFTKLRQHTAFEWMIDHNEIDDIPKLVDTMIEKIIAESDNINQYFFAKTLSEKTDVPLKVITEEIDRRRLLEDDAKDEKITHVVNDLKSKIRKGEPPKGAIEHSLRQIEEIEKSHSVIIDPVLNYQTFITATREKLIENGTNLQGYSFGKVISPFTKNEVEIFPRMHEWLDGLPRYGCLVSVGAMPGVGKTSFLRYLMFNIALANPDVRVIYMSIDDNKAKIVQSLVGQSQNIPLAKIRKPTKLSSEERKRWEIGWELVQQRKDNFIVFDAVDGTTLDSLEQYIKRSQMQYPDKRTIAVLDNFHKLTDYAASDPKVKNAICSERLKYFTTKYDIPIFMTVELRKFQSIKDEPTLLDLKDTVQISYDTDYVWLMHSDLYVNPESKWHWFDPAEQTADEIDGLSRKRPILKIVVAKNKETDFKGAMYFKFRDYMSQFFELNEDEERDYLRPKESEDENLTFGRSLRAGTPKV